MAVRRHIHKRTIKELVQRLDTFGQSISEEQSILLSESAHLVLQKAKEFAPVETGALRSTGRVEQERKKHGFIERSTAYIKFGGMSKITSRNAPDGIVRYAGYANARTHFLWAGYKAAHAEIMRKTQEAFGKTRWKKIRYRTTELRKTIIPVSRYFD